MSALWTFSLENLRRFQAGEPLRNLVDFATGYRKLS